MPKLIGNGHKLGRAGPRLLRNRGSECCCGPGEKAYRYAECCDGNPIIWIAERAFLPRSEPCDLVHVGKDREGNPICFHKLGDSATLDELDIAGIEYLESFNTAVGDGCPGGTNCGDGIALGVCRECPAECCIRGYPPVCKATDPRVCCVLGSAISVEWSQRRVERRWGNLFSLSGFTPSGGSITVGVSVDPIYEFIWETTVRATLVRYRNDGRPCVDISPSCYRRDTYYQRGFTYDNYRVTDNAGGYLRPSSEILLENPRYEVFLDATYESEFCNEPIYPEVIYAPVDWKPQSEESACRASWESLLCFDGPTSDTCPAPGNPWYRKDTLELEGAFSCNFGRQRYRFERETKTSPSDYPAGYFNPHPSGENPRYELVTVETDYRVVPLNSEGCEVRSCDDIGSGSGGPGGRSPLMGRYPYIYTGTAKGCSGCRQGPGL